MDYKPQIEAIPNNQPLQKQLFIHERVRLDMRASYFYELFKINLMLEVPAGETSTGHPASRMLMPNEALQRALVATSLYFHEIEAQGWVTEIPTIDELKGDVAPVGFRNA